MFHLNYDIIQLLLLFRKNKVDLHLQELNIIHVVLNHNIDKNI